MQYKGLKPSTPYLLTSLLPTLTSSAAPSLNLGGGLQVLWREAVECG